MLIFKGCYDCSCALQDHEGTAQYYLHSSSYEERLTWPTIWCRVQEEAVSMTTMLVEMIVGDEKGRREAYTCIVSSYYYLVSKIEIKAINLIGMWSMMIHIASVSAKDSIGISSKYYPPSLGQQLLSWLPSHPIIDTSNQSMRHISSVNIYQWK